MPQSYPEFEIGQEVYVLNPRNSPDFVELMGPRRIDNVSWIGGENRVGEYGYCVEGCNTRFLEKHVFATRVLAMDAFTQAILKGEDDADDDDSRPNGEP